MALRGEFQETVLGAPPPGWTLGHVTLTLNHPSERIPVEAWRRGAFAVHEVRNRNGRVTHAPKGLYVWTADSMDQAAEFVEAIEPLSDWAAVDKAFETGSELYPKVRAIMDRFVTQTEQR